MKRINRFEQDRGFVTAGGIKRIARGRDVSGEQSAAIAQSNSKPQRVIEQIESRILVCCHVKAGELSTLDREVIYVARALAELQGNTAVSIALFGQLGNDQVLAQAGVDECILLADEGADRYVPESKVAVLMAEYQRLQPMHVLFPEARRGIRIWPVVLRLKPA